MKIENINNYDEFEEYMKNYKFLIINISAPWCKPCKEIKPSIEKFVSVIHKKDFIYLKLDYDTYISYENFELLFKVNKIPYFCIIENKKIIFSIVSGDFLEVSTNLHKHITSCENRLLYEEKLTNNFNLNTDF
jgi:thiol-disulfide isomerase/thioredoxin